jgi:integrase
LRGYHLGAAAALETRENADAAAAGVADRHDVVFNRDAGREDAKTLLESIPKDSVSGLRDLALIAAMFYSFARVSAVLKLKVDDYYHNGARRRLRLHEKGGKEHEMPVHHLLEQILNEYVEAAGLRSGQPLFQSDNSAGTAVTGRTLNRYNAWAAIRKRAKAAGFLTPVGLTPPMSGYNSHRWHWTELLGRGKQKSYDRAILIGKKLGGTGTWQEHLGCDLKTSEMFIFFDIPFEDVLRLCGTRDDAATAGDRRRHCQPLDCQCRDRPNGQTTRDLNKSYYMFARLAKAF